MKRTDLYDLVWSKPMTHLAREYGISDVALRKTCQKHDIPTPPVGYWEKLNHGKPVRQIPLPKPENGGEDVPLVARLLKAIPPVVQAARQAAIELEAKPENIIRVPDKRPDDLHSIAEKVEKVLRKAKPDEEGFVHCDRKGLPCVAIGPDTIDRAIILIDTFIKAAILRGHTVSGKDGVFHVMADEEAFTVRLYETKDREPHEPTATEIRKQKEEDEWRSKYPDLYSADSKVYRSWDYFPSGRLSLEIKDPTAPGWDSRDLVGRWRDHRKKGLENYLPKAMAALTAAPAAVKHRRAEEAEKERIRAEEHARRQREVASRERAEKRQQYVMKKAEGYAGLQRMKALLEYMSREAEVYSAEPVGRIARVMESMIVEMKEGFERQVINEEITKLELFGDDDSV